ncbi:MAG TPA: nucleotide-binding protein [Vicinamibacteria bacterium]|nr:nucleotide-binding protein [Vicinamibacteria bacterium]HRB13261.1 nucleotide-binding protein [Vicinamibacteria bacterium]
MSRAAVLILPLFLAACGDTPATAAADGKQPPKAPSTQAAALPSNVTQPDETAVTGTVAETFDAGPYTYLRLTTASGDVWAAVNEAKLKVGTEVTVGNAIWMANFESKTLNRKFDRILFGSLMNEGDAAAAAALPPGHPPTAAAAQAPSGGAPAKAADQADVKVDKAPGKDAKTVAEIHANKAALKGVEVVVRGRVVKFNPEIMGRNWLHLRDGSGSADKQDNDITVTTSEVFAKGDIVTIRGKVVLDQDFTAGYAYPVMIEGAKAVK